MFHASLKRSFTAISLLSSLHKKPPIIAELLNRIVRFAKLIRNSVSQRVTKCPVIGSRLCTAWLNCPNAFHAWFVLFTRTKIRLKGAHFGFVCWISHDIMTVRGDEIFAPTGFCFTSQCIYCNYGAAFRFSTHFVAVGFVSTFWTPKLLWCYGKLNRNRKILKKKFE